MPSSKPSSEQPEIPPDIPPEYVDAYLAGFQRGLGGSPPDPAIEPVHSEPARSAPVDPVDQELARSASDESVHQPEVITPAGHGMGDEPMPNAALDAEPQRGGADLEWLFDRGENSQSGWSAGLPGESGDDSVDEPRTIGVEPVGVAPSGATSVAGEGPKSPWPLLGAFVVVLVLLMLLAYLGGMAFSTIVNR